MSAHFDFSQDPGYYEAPAKNYQHPPSVQYTTRGKDKLGCVVAAGRDGLTVTSGMFLSASDFISCLACGTLAHTACVVLGTKNGGL